MREWTAQEVRLRIERYLVEEGARLRTELLGTLVVDDDHLTVLVRYFGDGQGRGGARRLVGQVQSVGFDLAELYEEAGATTIERAVDEVLHGAVHFLDMREAGIDSSGIRHWD